MPGIAELITLAGITFLFALLGSVVIRVLTGGLRTRGLIDGTTSAGSQFVSAARVQLLIVSLLAAAQYLAQVWQSPQKLPEIPDSWLLLLGGSHVLYHATKINGKRNKRFQI
jgi:hypothetical protein